MPLAKDVAAELRLLADAFDTNPELEVVQPTFHMYYYGSDCKEQFLSTVRLLPKPLVKEYTEGDYGEVRVKRNSNAIRTVAEAPRKAVCELVHAAIPAKYKCDPLFAEDEINEAVS